MPPTIILKPILCLHIGLWYIQCLQQLLLIQQKHINFTNIYKCIAITEYVVISTSHHRNTQFHF